MLLKQIRNLIQKVNNPVDKSTNIEDMLINARLEYGLNAESVVFDFEMRIDCIDYNESSVERSAHRN